MNSAATWDPETIDAGLRERIAGLRLLCLDVDGVLTDGRLYFTDQGQEIKTFSTQDGQALKMLQGTGVDIAIITGRRSRLVARRARELGISLLHQGVADKRAVLESLLRQLDLRADQAAHVGDDIPDLPVLRSVGVAFGVANQHPVLRDHVHLVTPSSGGQGAVREACELIMRIQGTWDRALAVYL